MVISWPPVASAFPVAYHHIVTEDGIFVDQIKTTEFRFHCPPAGTHEYLVKAVDAAGNESGWGRHPLR